MKKIEVLNLPKGFEELKDVSAVNFAYALMKNRRIIEAEKEDLTKAITNEPNYLAFISKMRSLVTEYCDVEEGELIVPTEVKLKDGKDRKSFILSVLELKEEYSQEITDRRKIVREYNDFLREDAKIEFYKIRSVHLPEEVPFGKLLLLSELISFEKEIPTIDIQITNYQTLVYVNLFRELLSSEKIYNIGGDLRDKLIFSFLNFRNAHQALSNTPELKSWNEYEEERKLLAESFASTDVFGEILIEKMPDGQDQYVIEDQAKFAEALQKLSEEYKETIDNFYSLLNKTMTLSVAKISLDELPTDFSLEDLDKLQLFFEDSSSPNSPKEEVKTTKIRKLKPTNKSKG